MIRFGRILEQVTEFDRRKLAEVQAIFRKVFTGAIGYADKLPDMLRRRHELPYQVVILTCEDSRNRVLGFAIVHYYPKVEYAYLDFIASDPDVRKRGIGGAQYEALREYLERKGAKGLFMEVPPDDPSLVRDSSVLPINRKRLEFYERYGAFPIVGTRYEEPSGQGEPYDPPYLVFDPLGRDRPLPRTEARAAVRLVLHHRYGWSLHDPYLVKVVDSFRDDPIRLRAPKYLNAEALPTPLASPRHGRIRPIQVLVAEHHNIHHVHERGYVERPARVGAILRGLEPVPHERRTVRHHDEKHIREVHDPDFVSYLATACKSLGEKEALYPYVFPIRRPDRKPKDRSVLAGYYCIDTFTPLSQGAYKSARAAVDCAISGADLLLKGQYLVYSLCRPPGHHAERRVFGGFCYFNNSAIAAHHLSHSGRVALLDIDFHHGNGAQDIFYHRNDILVLSIHGHPNYAYPYFSGFSDERGDGFGRGYNRNYPLPESVDDKAYMNVLQEVFKQIRDFKPAWLVVSLGFDIMRGDPTGAFVLTTQGMRQIGQQLGRLGLPTLVVQEGGYTIQNLRRGARAFFHGLGSTWY